MSATVARLRALLAEATPGPWTAEERALYHVIFHREWPVAGGLDSDSADAALIAEARNALPALLAVAEAASDNHHTECLLHDTLWGGVDTCDNLGVKPGDSRRCPNCVLRDALAALDTNGGQT